MKQPQNKAQSCCYSEPITGLKMMPSSTEKSRHKPHKSLTIQLFLALSVYCLLEALDLVINNSATRFDRDDDRDQMNGILSFARNNHIRGSRDASGNKAPTSTSTSAATSLGLQFSRADELIAADAIEINDSSLVADTGDDQQHQSNDTLTKWLTASDDDDLVLMESLSRNKPTLSSWRRRRRRRRRQRRFSLPFLHTIEFASAIRLIRMESPSTIHAGQSMKLRCLYETKGDKLHSLAWYKNGREFYRYQPSERRQPYLAFDLKGINIDLSKSRNNSVILVNTTSETSGKYKCQATGTSFQEVNLETYIKVITVASGATTLKLNWTALISGLVSLFIVRRNH